MNNVRSRDVANSNSNFDGRELFSDTTRGVVICASCDSTEEIVQDEFCDEPALCRECRSPLLILDFPGEYCDLGDCD